MRPLRRHLTYANVVSLLVIVVATTGTSYAAAKRMYTGADIKDSTLTGIDFKNGTIATRDISATSYASMRGKKGPTGDAGAGGAAGAKGETGATGDMGKRAHSLVRYAWFTSPYLRTNPASPANPTNADWDDAAYAVHGGVAAPTNFAVDFGAEALPVSINENEPVMLQLTGNNTGTTGTIRPTSTGLLSATATLTILHENSGEAANHTGGLDLHSRVRCQLRYANNGAAVSASSPKLGAAEWLSTRRGHKVTTITITGSERISATSTSNYNVGVSCADVDRTGSDQWWFVAGNLTAHAVYVGP